MGAKIIYLNSRIKRNISGKDISERIAELERERIAVLEEINVKRNIEIHILKTENERLSRELNTLKENYSALLNQ